MPDIDKRLGRDVLVLDGAMGTMLQRSGVPPEQCPEQLNITGPDIVEQIHRDYVLAGADCVSTNTFGGTRAKLDEYGLGDQVVDFNRAGVRVAKRSGAQHVLADVGPTGRVLEPLGKATFDELFALFAEQIQALAAEEPDAIFIETMTDIAEARCAVLAARSVTDLPVIASVSFGLSGRMELSGTDPATAAIVLEAAGASVVGMNCGLGPDQMLPLVEQMAEATSLPLVVQPNAGLPTLVDGKTVFPGTPDQLGMAAARFVELGASLVGSCCGSTPAFTGAIVDFAKNKPLREGRRGIDGVLLAGPRGVARIGASLPFAVIGERINPTGKKRLADSLREGSMAVVREFAAEQQHAGAHLLDVNVGAAGVDATVLLRQAVITLGGITDLPLVLDNTDPAALEPALRVYPGRALINSVNGGEASMDSILPLAHRYGAAVVVLALDDDGIPATAEGRLAIVDRIRKRAHAFGLRDHDLVVDCLTLTAATDPHAAVTTLDAVRVVSLEWGLATVLGVSNVSHGLPGRPQLNAAFLAMAAGAGLRAAIINPSDTAAMGAVAAADALLGNDAQAERWIARVAAESPLAGPSEDKGALLASDSAAALLSTAIGRGDVDSAPALVDALIGSGTAPQAVIAEVLTPAIQLLGDAYGRGEVFLPQLIAAADAMKAAVDRAKSHLPEGSETHEGRVVFGTVKGDIHSIGKDICVSMLESQGFLVEDLGVDVAPERFVAAAADADAVCLSALMTTTLASMERTVAELASLSTVPVLVGGAVVTAEYAASIGAGYSVDAPGCVRAVREAIAAGREGQR
jgi:5-methyltetrahydrofolate--homocysteine methyltransferase